MSDTNELMEHAFDDVTQWYKLDPLQNSDVVLRFMELVAKGSQHYDRTEKKYSECPGQECHLCEKEDWPQKYVRYRVEGPGGNGFIQLKHAGHVELGRLAQRVGVDNFWGQYVRCHCYTDPGNLKHKFRFEVVTEPQTQNTKQTDQELPF